MWKIFSWFSVDKYYKMSDAELEREARKWNIREYGNAVDGTISRQIIIDQLIRKQQANNSRLAIFISALALLISIFSLFSKSTVINVMR